MMLTTICGPQLRTFGKLLREEFSFIVLLFGFCDVSGLKATLLTAQSCSVKGLNRCVGIVEVGESWQRKIDDEIRGVKENDTAKTERDWKKTEGERWSGTTPVHCLTLLSSSHSALDLSTRLTGSTVSNVSGFPECCPPANAHSQQHQVSARVTVVCSLCVFWFYVFWK